jgi:hypothetical protein
MKDDKPICDGDPQDLWGAMRRIVEVPPDLDLRQPSGEVWKAEA